MKKRIRDILFVIRETMQYDRNGLPRIEMVHKVPNYSKYFWAGCVAILILLWMIL